MTATLGDLIPGPTSSFIPPAVKVYSVCRYDNTEHTPLDYQEFTLFHIYEIVWNFRNYNILLTFE